MEYLYPSWGRKIKNTSPVLGCRCCLFLGGNNCCKMLLEVCVVSRSDDLKILPCIIIDAHLSAAQQNRCFSILP